jgi:hypothetical protein
VGFRGLTGGAAYAFEAVAQDKQGYAASAISYARTTAFFLPGDASGDGLVDVADYDIWAAHVGATNATWTMGDLNGDGLANVADYDIWAANVGRTS